MDVDIADDQIGLTLDGEAVALIAVEGVEQAGGAIAQGVFDEGVNDFALSTTRISSSSGLPLGLMSARSAGTAMQTSPPPFSSRFRGSCYWQGILRKSAAPAASARSSVAAGREKNDDGNAIGLSGGGIGPAEFEAGLIGQHVLYEAEINAVLVDTTKFAPAVRVQGRCAGCSPIRPWPWQCWLECAIDHLDAVVEFLSALCCRATLRR